jgi:hypothetical protein
MQSDKTSESGAEARGKSLMPIDDPVGAALRRLHDEVVAEPLPDDFLRLLGDIERKLDGTQAAE